MPRRMLVMMKEESGMSCKIKEREENKTYPSHALLFLYSHPASISDSVVFSVCFCFDFDR